MAAVLDAMAPYVKKLIADMAEEEVRILLGVSGEIDKLEENVESLNDFLADAERKRITDKSVQRWVRKLKDAMYDATDILDLCQLEADKRRESQGGSMEEKVPGCCRSLLFCLWNPMFAHKIGSRIKELNQRLDGIHKEADKLVKFNNIILGSNPEPRKLTDAEKSSQKTTSEFNESAIVGQKIESDTKELVQLLITGGNHDIKVVSIVGTGGMGKTTLAQKIFKEAAIQERFKVKIWLSITQHFDDTEMLQTAIKHAGGDHGGEQDKTFLTRTLTETLSTGRFLLVLDDVWSDKAWNHVLSVPVRNASQKQQGNWVLVTTRLGDLAQRMQASFYQHHVSPLNEEDAWSLLNKQLPLPPNQQIVGTDHLKDIGIKIINKCGGLPLAVKVMGGLLSTRPQSKREWEAVLNNQAWTIAGLPTELDSRIYLSYEDLSPQLKQCFLYCSLFPKGTNIDQSVVVPMWISEGFIQPHDRLEEVAIEYYEELIMRNLIEPLKDTVARYSCTMHDVVRSFAEFMAREEILVVQDRQAADGSNNNHLVRRMYIGPTELVPEWAVLVSQNQESLRTLIIDYGINFKLGDSLTSFSRLRVLYIKGADCDWLVESLCQLRHLRYLHLVDTDISRLPEDIHRMKLLQHIILKGNRNLDHLPISIIQLVHLRTLDMLLSNINVVPKRFGGLTNLRSLYGFLVHMDMDGDKRGWCSLEEIGPLSHVRDLRLYGLENVSASSFAEKAMISSKDHLGYLDLNWSSSGFLGSRDEIEKQQQQRVVEEVLEKLCPPSCIQDLNIDGYFGHRLPNWMMAPATAAFKSLMYLLLTHLPCCTQLPDGLCRLPSLEYLGIEDAAAVKSVGPEFQATVLVGVGGGAAVAFPSLTSLVLQGLCEWEEWDWEQQGLDVATADAMVMPALKSLRIRDCKLRCLPSGLANSKRHALRRLKLHDMTRLISVESFPSIVELDVFHCPELKRISGLGRLQKIRIQSCSNIEVLEGVPLLDSLWLEDPTIATLPGYMQSVSPRYLNLICTKKLCESLLTGCSSELDMISHIGKRDISYI